MTKCSWIWKHVEDSIKKILYNSAFLSGYDFRDIIYSKGNTATDEVCRHFYSNVNWKCFVCKLHRWVSVIKIQRQLLVISTYTNLLVLVYRYFSLVLLLNLQWEQNCKQKSAVLSYGIQNSTCWSFRFLFVILPAFALYHWFTDFVL